MNVPKGKASVSPPVQLGPQSQPRNIVAQPRGPTPPGLRDDFLYPSQPYQQVQQNYNLPGPLPHEMNSKQVTPGRIGPTGVTHPGLFTQQTVRSQGGYYQGAPQNMRPQRPPTYMGTTQPNPAVFQMMYMHQGQSYQGQSYQPPAGLMVQSNQMLQYQSTRMPTVNQQFNLQTSQPLQQFAQYGNAQQFNSTPPYYYPTQQQSVPQPPRPSSAGQQPQTQVLQKRERKPIPIVDPESGKEVVSDLSKSSTPPSSRSTPVGSTPSQQINVVAAQFAAQVAATLQHSPHQAAAQTGESTQKENVSEAQQKVETNSAVASIGVEAITVPEQQIVCEDATPETESVVQAEEENKELSPSPTPEELPHELQEEHVSAVPEAQEAEEVLEEEPVEQAPEMVQIEVSGTVEDNFQKEEIPEINGIPGDLEMTNEALEAKETEVIPSSALKDSPVTVVVASDVNTEESSASSHKKHKGKKQRNEELNRKGESKQGSDMDAFLGEDKQKTTQAEILSLENSEEMEKSEETLEADKKDEKKDNQPEKTETEIEETEERSSPSSQTEEKIDPLVETENKKNDVKSNDMLPVPRPEESAPKYTYTEDQCAPHDPEKKKQYDREFLLKLQDKDESRKKPEGLPYLPDIILDQPHARDSSSKSYNSGNHMPDFTPGFFKTHMGRMPGPGSMTKRGSQSHREKRVIKSVSIQRPEEVQLHQSANAYKMKKKGEASKTEDNVTDDLYREVRSILNKLTPQNFNRLILQVQKLEINTETRLKGVAELIFEKAISESNFSVAYANLCRYLTQLKVPYEGDPPPGSTENSVNFRAILLTKCQREFEKDKDNEEGVAKKQKELEEVDTEEKKKLLMEEIAYLQKQARMRSTGNIRFIGELFKLRMLTETIMHDCVFKLLKSKHPEDLECLCRLLTTIGRELDVDKAKARVEQYFQQIEKLKSDKKYDSRIRFMLQDVLDLRANKWQPRRQANNPKTIQEIHNEAAREDAERAVMLQNNPPSRDRGDRDRRPNRPMRGQQAQGTAASEDGWNTVGLKVKAGFDASKLKITKTKVDEDIQLGPGGAARGFGWSRGSSGGGSRTTQESDRLSTPSNRFSALSNRSEDEGRSRAFGRGAAVSPARGDSRNRGVGGFKGKLMTRNSQERERERERALAQARNIGGRSTPPSQIASRENSQSREPAWEPEKKSSAKELNEEEMERRAKNIIDEYLHGKDKKEAFINITEIRHMKNFHLFVSTVINHVLERSNVARQQTGLFFHDLINEEVVTAETYLQGLDDTLQIADDMEIDIPMIWQYLGELIGPMIQDSSLPLNFLLKACEPLKRVNKAGTLLAEVLHDTSQRLGHKKVAELWRKSGLSWADFVPKEKVDQFLKDKNLEFTVQPDSCPSTPTSKVSMVTIQDQLEDILKKSSMDNESVFTWIEDNVPEEMTKEPSFIRSLMTAVCTCALSGPSNSLKMNPEVIKKRKPLLQKYLDHVEVFELHALYALQALVHKLEHPPGVLRSFFDTLYDEEIISEDAFNQWESSSDPAEKEGKGVALKQVVQFFAWLREGDDDGES